MASFGKMAGYGFYRFILFIRQYLGDKSFILLLSVLAGTVSGLAAVVLKTCTEQWGNLAAYICRYTGDWFVPVLPAFGILICTALVRIFAKGPYDKSLAGVIRETSKGTSNVPGYHCFSHIITSSLAVGLGGSAGLEAPIALTGSALGSNMAKFLRTGNATRTLLLACAGGAGISAIFNSPVAGALFACEILLPEFSVGALVPLLMASASAAVVSEILHEHTPFVTLTSGWNMANIPFYILLGILAGLVSSYTIRMSILAGKWAGKYKNVWLKAIGGSVILYLFLLLFPALRGQGYGYITALVNGHEFEIMKGSPLAGLITGGAALLVSAAVMVFLKVLSASATLESGGDGGIFAPSMFIGAFLGFCMARAFNMFFTAWGVDYQLSEINFLCVGMGGVLAGVMHAPMTGMFLIAEMTGGYVLFIPLMIAVALSSFISRRLVRYNIYKSALAVRGETPDEKQSSAVMEGSTILSLVENNFLPVRASDTLRVVLKKIMESKRNIYPVLDEQGKLEGVVTLDDVRPFLLDESLYDIVVVYDMMKQHGRTLDINASLASAVRLFETTNTWCLPVLENGLYAGFVSKAGVFEKYREILRNKPELF